MLIPFFERTAVLVVRYGRADMKGILSSAKKKDYLMVVIGLTESIAQINYKNLSKYQFKPGDSMIQSTVIFDMEGFSMRHITYKPGEKKSMEANSFVSLWFDVTFFLCSNL